MKEVNVFGKPGGNWSTADYAVLAFLVAAAGFLFLSGLSVRSLWGSEGRWAVIAREMMQSGHYFLPTINGEVYFDKPLMSYWAIIPFSYFGGVTEASARIPGALAGIATVGLIFVIGRKMFGRVSGFASGAILLTTVMFGFWSRTASAETLNVLAIWLMLWAIPASGEDRSFGRYLLFYIVAAISSFCKGPLAPAVALIAVCAISCVEAIHDSRKNNSPNAWRTFTGHFHWILSGKGFLAALCGLTMFAFLLFLPVMVSGSWNAVELMWRENVVRFVKPFDHVEPFYIYLKYIPIFLLPWTFVMIASLFTVPHWEKNSQRRWIVTATIAIFLFFTISGSRRSYYILPIVPACALIMGRSLCVFFARITREENHDIIKYGLIITGFLPLIAGCALIAAYLGFPEYRHLTELIIGPVVIIGSVAALFFLLKGKNVIGAGLTGLLLFALLFWANTAGGVIGERSRTLRTFADQTTAYITGAGDDRLALYGVGNSSLIFYLNRSRPIRKLHDANEACAFLKNEGRYLLTEPPFVDILKKQCGGQSFIRVVTQVPEDKKAREGLVLLQSR
ncbi:MAG: glycosyltransferase family 39 protein [Syntrophorhabdus sp.]